ncbi:hypothetical protein ACSQ67_013447 [Phaseolus vulgaris]
MVSFCSTLQFRHWFSTIRVMIGSIIEGSGSGTIFGSTFKFTVKVMLKF